MKTHCLHCNGPHGRIDNLQRVNSELAWVVWKCQTCALVWSTPILSEDDAGSAIAEHMLAIMGATTGPGRYEWLNDEYVLLDQPKIDQQITDRVQARGPLGNECECGLPKHLCTIDGHGPNYGQGE